MTVAGVIAVCVKVTALINAVRETVDSATGLVFSIRKFVDSFGNVSAQIYYKYDSDGDGELDAEEVIYNIDSYIPDLDEPYQLVDRDGKIGLGYPQLKLVDASDVFSALPSSDLDNPPALPSWGDGFTSDGSGFRIALDDDGVCDDVLYPLPFDFSGDGVNDFQIIVDDNNNGLPDAAPNSPFYPIGSEGYQEIVEKHSDNVPALSKSFKNYTVTEALLFVIACGSLLAIFSKIFRRRKI